MKRRDRGRARGREWRMVSGRGDTSPRFDALPRGNGRWRSRKAVGGERFAGLRIVWRKKTIEAGSLRCKEKEGCCPGKGGFSIADSRAGWVWSQLWPVTLRLGLTGSIHKVLGPRLQTFHFLPAHGSIPLASHPNMD